MSKFSFKDSVSSIVSAALIAALIAEFGLKKEWDKLDLVVKTNTNPFAAAFKNVILYKDSINKSAIRQRKQILLKEFGYVPGVLLTTKRRLIFNKISVDGPLIAIQPNTHLLYLDVVLDKNENKTIIKTLHENKVIFYSTTNIQGLLLGDFKVE